MKDHIVLLDPALKNNSGEVSGNLGDLIIGARVLEIIHELFPGRELIRLSSHSFLSREHRKLINTSSFNFIGGTNVLRSDMITYRQILFTKGSLRWLFPGIRNFILFGTGWGPDYKQKLTARTKILYRNILHSKMIHSVRDEFSANKLETESGLKVLNTSCPTTWRLNGMDPNITGRANACLFTLTDYQQSQIEDAKLLQTLLAHFENLTFFPQGQSDLQYISTLNTYKQNRGRINLLPHSYSSFCEYVKTENFIYVGTRLHAGIKCLENGKKALILAVDNRALQMQTNTNLPVIPREDNIAIGRWLQGEKIFGLPIEIPLANIAAWKHQFAKF